MFFLFPTFESDNSRNIHLREYRREEKRMLGSSVVGGGRRPRVDEMIGDRSKDDLAGEKYYNNRGGRGGGG